MTARAETESAREVGAGYSTRWAQTQSATSGRPDQEGRRPVRPSCGSARLLRPYVPAIGTAVQDQAANNLVTAPGDTLSHAGQEIEVKAQDGIAGEAPKDSPTRAD